MMSGVCTQHDLNCVFSIQAQWPAQTLRPVNNNNKQEMQCSYCWEITNHIALSGTAMHHADDGYGTPDVDNLAFTLWF